MRLSLGTQKWIYGIIILVLLIFIGRLWYVKLGGTEKIAIHILKGKTIYIIGKYFKGYYAHPTIKRIWEESKILVEEGKIPGDLIVVNFENDSLKGDEVEQFIGVTVKGNMAEVPVEFEVRKFQINNKMVAYLTMHPIVRPNPAEIMEKFQKLAKKQGLSLADYSLEIHFPDNSMQLEVPILN